MHSDRQIHPAMLVVLFAIGALSVLGYSYVSRLDPARSESRREVLGPPPSVSASNALGQGAEETASAPSSQSDESAAPSSASAAAGAPQPPSSSDVANWIADATGSDARKRAAAIVALGSAPASDALPALASVLDTSDEDDRKLALTAMRALAQGQGDDDGRIRDVVRNTIYHGSDEAVTTAAQATLDDIEGDIN